MKRFNWGTGIFLFFVVFLTLAFIFIVFSFRQNNDLVTDDYYNEGAEYSNQIKINKRSYAYTDSVVVFLSKTHVNVVFTPENELNTNQLKLHFYYPAGENNDAYFEYEKFSDTLSIDKRGLTHGRCILKLSWFMFGEEYNLEKMLYID